MLLRRTFWQVRRVSSRIFHIYRRCTNAVKHRKCVWLVRAEGRLKSEEWGGRLVAAGGCLFRTTLTDLRPRASHKIQHLPHPTSLKKNTILFKVYRQSPPHPSPSSTQHPCLPPVASVVFPGGKAQWCAKSLKNSPQLYRIWGLLCRSGTSEALPFAFETPCAHFSRHSKASRLAWPFFSPKNSVCGCWSRLQESSIYFF